MLVVLGVVLLFVLTAAWIFSLFALVGDSISFLAKVVWFVALTCLAPFAIPVYLVTRHHRRSREPAPGGIASV
jgi:hypothetical protein